MAGVHPLAVASEVSHAYHLYVVRLELEALTADRAAIFRASGLKASASMSTTCRSTFILTIKTGSARGRDMPVAEAAHERLLSLSMFPAMSDKDVADVIEAVDKVVSHYRR